MVLIVRQVYNNNTVLVKVSTGIEAIIQGKGIGFGKHQNDVVDSRDVSELLYLNDKRVDKHLSTMLRDLPINIVATTFDIIEMATKKYHYHVMEYIYITLADHIFQMYKHITEGTYQTILTPNIQDSYPLEYKIAEEAIKILNYNLDVHFPETEIKNIALHFINAKDLDSKNVTNLLLTKKVNVLVNQIFTRNKLTRTALNKNFFDRLMVHLEYLVERLNDNKQDNSNLGDIISRDFKNLYPKSFEIVSNICHELETQLNVQLNYNERIYFLIHIQRLINEEPLMHKL